MFTVLDVESMQAHFSFWLSMLAVAEPIDPMTLPKDLRLLLDKLNEDACGTEPGSGCESSWACRFTGWLTAELDKQTPENEQTFYLCGPKIIDIGRYLIIGGDFDPVDVRGWDEGIGSFRWPEKKAKARGAKGKAAKAVAVA